MALGRSVGRGGPAEYNAIWPLANGHAPLWAQAPTTNEIFNVDRETKKPHQNGQNSI